MRNISALLFTLIAGGFFILGFLFVKFVKRKKELSILATAMALVVMLGMIFSDLIPEITSLALEVSWTKVQKMLFIGGSLILGMVILKGFDLLIPHHHHDHHEHEKNHHEHNEHLYHIGFMTAFSLGLHNILEGMSIYVIGCESITAGLLTAIAVGCHNLPLGIEVASSLDHVHSKKTVRLGLMLFLSLSSAVGASILFLIGSELSSIFMLGLISVACGMILYIAAFELLPEVMHYLKRREIYYGIAIGILLILIMNYIH